MKHVLPPWLIRLALAAAVAACSPAVLADHDLTCHPTAPTSLPPRPQPIGWKIEGAKKGAVPDPGVHIRLRLAGDDDDDDDDDLSAHGSIVFVPGATHEHATVLVADGTTAASCAYVDGPTLLTTFTLLLFDAHTRQRSAALVTVDASADPSAASFDAWLHPDPDPDPDANSIPITLKALGRPATPDNQAPGR